MTYIANIHSTALSLRGPEFDCRVYQPVGMYRSPVRSEDYGNKFPRPFPIPDCDATLREPMSQCIWLDTVLTFISRGKSNGV